jgi:hypothetical protein
VPPERVQQVDALRCGFALGCSRRGQQAEIEALRAQLADRERDLERRVAAVEHSQR